MFYSSHGHDNNIINYYKGYKLQYWLEMFIIYWRHWRKYDHMFINITEYH